MTSTQRMQILAIGLLTTLAAIGAGLEAGTRADERGFDARSLQGSFGTVGRAGAGRSVSVGVAEFDGFGKVTRFVRINTEGSEGDRRLIDLTSEGTYTVNADGSGVIEFTNRFADGSTNRVTFDFVIRRSGSERPGGSPSADEIFAIQREAGVTASLVEESFTRRSRRG